MDKNISEQIKSIIAQECGTDAKYITNKTLFMNGQKLPYFGCVNALFDLQHKFHVQLPESDYYKYKNVGNLIKIITKQIRAK